MRLLKLKMRSGDLAVVNIANMKYMQEVVGLEGVVDIYFCNDIDDLDSIRVEATLDSILNSLGENHG